MKISIKRLYVFLALCMNCFPFGFSYYDTKAVFLALGITAVVCIAVTVFCFQTKVRASRSLVPAAVFVLYWDLLQLALRWTSPSARAFSASSASWCLWRASSRPSCSPSNTWVGENGARPPQLLVFSNSCLSFQIYWLHMLYAALGAIVFTLVSFPFGEFHASFWLVVVSFSSALWFLRSSWRTTRSYWSGTGSTPSVQRSTCSLRSPSTSTSSRSSCSCCKS